MVSKESMIRIAFWFDAPVAYSGGLNYIANLLYAISVVKSDQIVPYVFFSTDVPADIICRFERYAVIIRTPILKRRTFPWLVHKVLYKLFGSMVIVDLVMKKYDISVLSHAWTPYLGRRRIKVISWIPDFQYLHLPAMFPHLDLEKENKFNRKIATLADATIVSSEHALGDLLSLIPRSAQPLIEVLRFVSQPFSAVNQQLPQLDTLEVKYGFKGNFFLLPNQFWAHKNHEVVLRALAIIKRTGQSVTVLMTGNTRDYRLEGTPYIDSLVSIIKELNIDEEARILGLIDYNDLLSLMHHCVGFINPSRFEGWSSSVEEAKSLGKAILMSRIPVHVEQAPDHGAYFECDDANKLAELMLALWRKHDLADQAAQMQAARSDLLRRTQAFGLQYVRLVRRVFEKSGYES